MNSNQIDTEGIEAIKLDLKRRHKEAFDEQLAISIINAAKLRSNGVERSIRSNWRKSRN